MTILVFIELVVVTVALLRADCLAEHEGRVPAYAPVTLLAGAGIVLGLITFVSPGLYLLLNNSV